MPSDPMWDASQMTDDDRAALVAIELELDDAARIRLMRAYWQDGARADRTPRSFLYFHLGLVTGIADRLLSRQGTVH